VTVTLSQVVGGSPVQLGAFSGIDQMDLALAQLSAVLAAGAAPSSWYVRVDAAGASLIWRATVLNIPADHVVYVLSDPPNTRATLVCLPGLGEHLRLMGEGLMYMARLDLRVTSVGGPGVDAIVVDPRASLVLDACELVAAGDLIYGIRAEPPANQLVAVPAGAVRLESTLVSGFETGVSVRGLERFEVVDSVVEECGVGAEVVACEQLSATNSHFEGARTALSLSGASTSEWSVSDCRFANNRIALDIDLSGTSPAGCRVSRCEFKAPSWWETTPSIPPLLVLRAGLLWESVGVRTRVVGPTSRVGSESVTPAAVVVESSVFHLLTRGIVARPSLAGRTLLDHNTFSHCAEAGVTVGGLANDWLPTRSGPDLGAPSSPSLIVSNSIFLGGPPSGAGARGGVELPVHSAGFFDASAVTSSQPQGILLARNLFWDFGPWPQRRVFQRRGAIVTERLVSGDHRHLGTPFAQLGRDPVLASQLSGLRPDSFDYHPMKALGSNAVERAFDFFVANGGGVSLLKRWGFPSLGRFGFYGNERPGPDVMDLPPPSSVGAAEPAGWVEFPLFGLNVAANTANQTTGVDQDVVDHWDVITFPAGLLGKPTPQTAASLSGDPVQDAWELFQGDALALLASDAKAAGLKVVASVTIKDARGGYVRLQTPRGLRSYRAPESHSALSFTPNIGERIFRDFWVTAATAFFAQVNATGWLSPLVAWWWVPEEVRANLTGLPKEYGLALRLREAMASLPKPARPAMTFESSSTSGAGSAFAVELAGGASQLENRPPEEFGESLLSVPGLAGYLWADRFQLGDVSGGAPLSVSRPTDQAVAFSQPVPGDEVAQLQVGYTYFPSGNPNVLTPLVDHLGFRVGHIDGMFPGNYVDRALAGQAAAQGLGGAPSLLENRIFALHRLNQALEGRDNAQFMLEPFSQALHYAPIHHYPEMFIDWFDDEDDPYRGRLWPELPTLAAHDMLIGLAGAQGAGLPYWGYRAVTRPPAAGAPNAGGEWLGMSGNPTGLFAPPQGSGLPAPDHPGWPGYSAVLKLIKSELREFLVCGERDFDLGFEVTSPAVPEDQRLDGEDYGSLTGWVGPDGYPRLSRTVLRVRNVVYLLVGHSASDETTAFRFCDPTRYPAATAEQVLTGYAGSGGVAVAGGSGTWLTASLSGIAARVFRITL